MPDSTNTTPSPAPLIAIAGATGRVGSALAALLGADPVAVRALSRRPEAAALPAGMGAARVDFQDPRSLQTALQGVDSLFISQGTSATQVANEIALIDAAVACGVRHIVKLSAMGPATRLLPFAWHRQVEAHLALQPVASTVLRPTAFAYLLQRVGAQIAAGAWAGAAGEGRTNFIDTRDVAAVARVALLQAVEPASQRAYHLTGPRAWSMAEVAEELARLLGHPVRYIHRPPVQQRQALLDSGLGPFVADLLLGLEQMFRESVLGETTSTVQELTGQAPRPLTEWLRDNLASFKA